MIFPKDTSALFSLVNQSPANLLLGKRIPGPGGNEAEHKTFQRLAFRGVPVQDLTHSRALQRLFSFWEKRACEHGLEEQIVRLAKLRPEHLETDWKGFLFGMSLRDQAPATANFIESLDRLNLDLSRSWQEGQKNDVRSRLQALPWAGSATMRWFLDHLEGRPEVAGAEAFFPTELQGLVISFLVYGSEIGDSPNRTDTWSLRDLAATRHPKTGHLAAIRFYLDRLQRAATLPSQNALFNLILDGTDKMRQGKRYRAGEVPAMTRAFQFVERVEHLLPGGKLGQAASEMRSLALCSVVFQNAFKRCQKVAVSAPDFDPLWPFEDFEHLPVLGPNDVLTAICPKMGGN